MIFLQGRIFIIITRLSNREKVAIFEDLIKKQGKLFNMNFAFDPSVIFLAAMSISRRAKSSHYLKPYLLLSNFQYKNDNAIFSIFNFTA